MRKRWAFLSNHFNQKLAIVTCATRVHAILVACINCKGLALDCKMTVISVRDWRSGVISSAFKKFQAFCITIFLSISNSYQNIFWYNLTCHLQLVYHAMGASLKTTVSLRKVTYLNSNILLNTPMQTLNIMSR